MNSDKLNQLRTKLRTQALRRLKLKPMPKSNTGKQKQIVNPIPYYNWPLWAKSIARAANPEDLGLGDVIARLLGPDNSEAFKQWYRRIFHKDCGCSNRQRMLNLQYPLPVQQK